MRRARVRGPSTGAMWALVVGTTLITAGLPRPARAGHTDEPDVDTLAESLDAWDVRLSLVRFDVGVYENVQLGTYYWLWLAKARNLWARWTFWQTEKWAAAAQLGFLAFNPRDLNEDFETNATFRIIPFKTQLTYTLNPDTRFTVGLAYAQTISDASKSIGSSPESAGESAAEAAAESAASSTDGSSGSSETTTEIEGTFGVSTARMELAAEWRWSDVTAFGLESQIMLFQNGGAAANETFQIDPRTRIELYQKGSGQDDNKFRANIGGNVQFAWNTFHLKAGVYFGEWVVPMVGAFVPGIPLIPELDMSWRW